MTRTNLANQLGSGYKILGNGIKCVERGFFSSANFIESFFLDRNSKVVSVFNAGNVKLDVSRGWKWPTWIQILIELRQSIKCNSSGLSFSRTLVMIFMVRTGRMNTNRVRRDLCIRHFGGGYLDWGVMVDLSFFACICRTVERDGGTYRRHLIIVKQGILLRRVSISKKGYIHQ